MLTDTRILIDWRAAFFAHVGRKTSSSTLATYRQALGAFERYFEQTNGQAFTPDLLNSWDLRGFRTWCLEVAQLAPSTWNLRRAALNRFSEWCLLAGHISSDPMSDVPGADRVKLAPRWLDSSDFGRLMRQVEIEINAANTEIRRWRALRDQAMVALMVFAGLRVSEVVALGVKDVQIGERAGRVIVRLGKGQKYREIPLNREARRAISAWLEARAAVPVSGTVSGCTLFVERNGSSLSTRAVEKRMAVLRDAAGVTSLTPHQLRHTCAKRIVDAGRALTEVQLILGHSKIETTARYAQAGWSDLEEAVEAVTLGKNNQQRR